MNKWKLGKMFDVFEQKYHWVICMESLDRYVAEDFVRKPSKAQIEAFKVKAKQALSA